MTAIAYANGVMAADSLISSDGFTLGFGKKIARSPEGDLGGAAGASGACHAFNVWFEAGGYRNATQFDPKSEAGKFSALIVRADGSEVFRMDHLGRLAPEEAPFHTEGYPIGLLTGALAMGASAEQAVRIAIKLDGSCGGDVQIEYLARREDGA